MKRILHIILSGMLILACTAYVNSYLGGQPVAANTIKASAPNTDVSKKLQSTKKKPLKKKHPKTKSKKTEDNMMNIKMTAADTTFSVKLYDNKTTQAFIKQLPLTITMDELNENEKFYYLSDTLPTDLYQPEKIKTGDLMLYGSDCLVLFYENFSTPFSYTKLGFIEDVSGLSDVLGDGEVQITFRN